MREVSIDRKQIEIYANTLIPEPLGEREFHNMTALNRSRYVINRGARTADDLIEHAAHYASEPLRQNVYCTLVYGKVPDGEDLVTGRDKRIAAKSTAGIVGFGLDFDLIGSAHQSTKQYCQSLQEVESLYDPQFPATMSIHSGHGIQPYWLFEEPFPFFTEADRLFAAETWRMWHYLFKLRARLIQRDIDPTFDLPRILRVGGTVNYKVPSDLKPVTVLHADGPRYSIYALREAFEESQSAASFARSRMSQAYNEGDFTIKADARISDATLNALCMNDPKFKRTWEFRRPDLHSQSQSEYDLALANLMVPAGWTDQMVVDLLVHHRSLRNVKQIRYRGYYARTIGLAREAAFGPIHQEKPKGRKAAAAGAEYRNGTSSHAPPPEEEAKEEKEEAPPPPPPDPAFLRAMALEELQAQLGFNIHRIVKLQGDKPLWKIFFENTEIAITANVILNQSAFATVCFEHLKPLGRECTKHRWHQITRLIWEAAELSPMQDPEQTDAQILRMYLNSYLRKVRFVRTQADLPGDPESPVIDQETGAISVYSPSLRAFIHQLTRTTDWNSPRTKSAMLALGAHSDHVSIGEDKQSRYFLPMEIFNGKKILEDLSGQFKTGMGGDNDNAYTN